MAEQHFMELGNVQKTMILPLWGRAVETAKPKPLLVDRAAAEIVANMKFDFSGITARISPMSQAAWIMRAQATDEVARAFLAAHPRGTVVNIGCGMDTTFERVDNGRLRWYDLDLPDVIRMRRRWIPESERRIFLAVSFLEESWLNTIRVDESALFLAAGVFYYFTEEDVRGFLVRLADRFPGAEALFDVCSPYGMKVANRMVIRNAGLDEKSNLTWGLRSTRDLIGWDRRFRLRKEHFYYRCPGLPLRLRLIGRISDWLRIQYMIHMQLGG